MTSNFENYEPVPKEIKIGKKSRLLLIGFFLISTLLVLLNASINFWLNVIEFGELFLRPIYFGFIVMNIIVLSIFETNNFYLFTLDITRIFLMRHCINYAMAGFYIGRGC